MSASSSCFHFMNSSFRGGKIIQVTICVQLKRGGHACKKDADCCDVDKFNCVERNNKIGIYIGSECKPKPLNIF